MGGKNELTKIQDISLGIRILEEDPGNVPIREIKAFDVPNHDFHSHRGGSSLNDAHGLGMNLV